MTTTPEFFVSEYRKAGYREIGGGLYSKVYAKDGADWCIKVGRQLDGYLAFVQLAVTEGWIGSHAPYIYSLKVVNGFYITTMERLAVCLADAKRPLADKVFDADPDGWRDRKALVMTHVARLRRTVPNTDLRYDGHGWNWMLRKDASLVMIDPIAGETERPVMTAWRNPNPRPVVTPHPLLAA